MWLQLVVVLGLALPVLQTLQVDELDVALLDAARAGDTEEIDELLEKGADIETRVAPKSDDDTAPEMDEPDVEAGATPLIIAGFGGHAGAVELLIKNGADVSARDDAGFTALERAAYAGHFGVVELLLENGASAAGDSMALLWAARQGRRRVVRLLLEAGADPNAAMPMGWTPLMFAAESGEAGIVSDLIASGADVNAVSKNRYTAMRCALERGRDDIAEVLEKAGAKKQGPY